jgi:ArsR family transcriptional regulator
MIADARQPESLLAWMESLADQTRLRLLHLLERQELGVAEICEVLQLPQSTVSRHLKVLADQQWVRSRPQGTANLYRMARRRLDPAARRLWQLSREQTEGWATLHQDQLRLARRLEDRGRNAQAFFAGAAGEWDRMRAELYGTSFSAAALLALVPEHWVVADLGCGTGEVTAALAQQVARVVGVDQSAAMLKAAARRTAGLANVELRQGALEDLPIQDDACDAALLVLVLSYTSDPGRILGELTRILRPGGRAVIVDLVRHDRDDFRLQLGQQSLGFDRNVLNELLEDAGLTAATFRELPPEPQATGPALFLSTAARPTTNDSGDRPRASRAAAKRTTKKKRRQIA